MIRISSTMDLTTWIANTNPGGVLTEPSLAERLAEVLRTASGRPAWGEDWEAFLNAHAESALERLAAEQV